MRVGNKQFKAWGVLALIITVSFAMYLGGDLLVLMD